jgi:hypothetical protein
MRRGLSIAVACVSCLLALGQSLPPLSLKPSDRQAAVLSWPYSNAGFRLEQASALTGANWQTSLVQPAFSSSNAAFIAPLALTGSAQFFRLDQPADLRGIYVYVPLELAPNAPAAAPLTAVINERGVDGLLIVGLWSSIETNLNQYDWGHLDKWMNYAALRKKKVNLSIRAGDGIPDWLFLPPPVGAGATKLTFTISPKDGKTKFCQTDVITVPWEDAFLNAWDALLSNVAAHLRTTGTYTNLTLLRLTGINRASDELRLPAETPDDNRLTGTGLDCVSNAPAIWQAQGYTPAKLLEAWTRIVNSFDTSFPDKSFSVAIIPNPPQLAFPPIDNTGTILTNNLPDLNQPLLELASQLLPGRLVVQFNFLITGSPANPAVSQSAAQFGTLAAFQANDWFAASNAGSACGGTVPAPAPCDDAAYLELMQEGIYPLGSSNQLRAQYIEVWATNAVVFTNAIWQAHLELLGGP